MARNGFLEFRFNVFSVLHTKMMFFVGPVCPGYMYTEEIVKKKKARTDISESDLPRISRQQACSR